MRHIRSSLFTISTPDNAAGIKMSSSAFPVLGLPELRLCCHMINTKRVQSHFCSYTLTKMATSRRTYRNPNQKSDLNLNITSTIV